MSYEDELRFSLERGRVPRADRLQPAHGGHLDEALALDRERYDLEQRLAWVPALGPMPRRDWQRLLALRRELKRRR